MSTDIIPVLINKETVSDDFYLIIDLPFMTGDDVKVGDIILSYETSKTVIDVEASASGFVHYNVEEEQEIAVGAVCAAITNKAGIPEDYFDQFKLKETQPSLQKEVTPSSVDLGQYEMQMRISKPAKKMLEKHQLDLSLFEGKKILTTRDIQHYLYPASQVAITSDTHHQAHNKLIIIGGGGHAKMCIDIIQATKSYELVGIVDENLEIGSETLGVPIIGNEADLDKLYQQGINFCVIGLGALNKPVLRQEIFHRVKKIGYILPNIIHPRATLEPSVSLGEGNQIMAGAVVGSDVHIGDNCIINSNSTISHDSRLANNVHITPGAILAGTVTVGSNAIIGMGVTVLMNVTIGHDVVIANGVNVVKDIDSGLFLKN